MENISPSLLTCSSRRWGESGLCPHRSIKIALLMCANSLTNATSLFLFPSLSEAAGDSDLLLLDSCCHSLPKGISPHSIPHLLHWHLSLAPVTSRLTTPTPDPQLCTSSGGTTMIRARFPQRQSWDKAVPLTASTQLCQ